MFQERLRDFTLDLIHSPVFFFNYVGNGKSQPFSCYRPYVPYGITEVQVKINTIWGMHLGGGNLQLVNDIDIE